MRRQLLKLKLSKRPRRRQYGLTLVELMISITIALFLLLGLASIFQTTRFTYGAQQGLAGVQDNGSVAMIMLANAIESAGYYASPQTNPRTLAFPANAAAAPFATAETVYGTSAAAAPGDTIAVRYDTSVIGGAIDCVGGNTGSVVIPTVNVFSISAAAPGAPSQLQCAVSVGGAPPGAPTPLVSGITNMTITYGVDTTLSGSATQYLDATAVAAGGYWNSVISVRVELTLANPLAGQPGQLAGILLTRTIPIMSRL